MSAAPPAAPGATAPPAEAAAPSMPPAAAESRTEFVQVDRQRLADWNGDYHAALGDAKFGRDLSPIKEVMEHWRQAGYTAEQIGQLMQHWLQSDGADQAPAAGAQDSAALRREVAQLRAMLQQFTTGLPNQLSTQLRQHQQQVQTEYERQSQRQAAERAIQNYGVDLAEKLGHAVFNQDGTENPPGMMFYETFMNALRRVQMQQEPKGLKAEDRDHYYACPTPEQFQQAEKQIEWLRSYRLHAAASVAKEQGKIPSETLGAGPGGKQQPPKFEDMTPEQKQQVVMQGLVPED